MLRGETVATTYSACRADGLAFEPLFAPFQPSEECREVRWLKPMIRPSPSPTVSLA
jgi:hypothetical protein